MKLPDPTKSADPMSSVFRVTSSIEGNHHFGTAFLFHQEAGASYLLTCRHVLEQVGGAEFALIAGLEVALVAAGEPSVFDMAVMRVAGLQDHATLRLGPTIEQGASCHIIGYRQYANEPKLTEIEARIGPVSRLGEEPHVADGWDVDITLPGYALEPGYSGAPVVDRRARAVVGIITHSHGGAGTRGFVLGVANLRTVWPVAPAGLFETAPPHPPPAPFGDFVDRTAEIGFVMERFQQRDERLILVLLGPKQGKSYFMQRLLHDFRQQAVPAALVDFQNRYLVDFRDVSRDICRQLGKERVPNLFGCLERAYSDADQARFTFGQALHDDLALFGSREETLVLLVDTLEKIAEDTWDWLEHWLFDPIPETLFAVIAGLPARCASLLDRPSLRGRGRTLTSFSQLTASDIMQLFQLRAIDYRAPHVEVAVELALKGPGAVAQLCDLLSFGLLES